ncbi:MAG: XdhC family protein [Rhizobiales bacterium]|nr:XdhC family protein [Hyphomicrobiales bacterium]
MDQSLIAELNKARENRQAAILVRDLADGSGRLVRRETLASDDPLYDAMQKRFLNGKSGIETVGEQEFFLNVEVPAPRIIIIGAVHISQALVPMVQQCGFDLTIIDPRTAFATQERFQGITLQAEWPEDIWSDGMVDAYTAMVVITHDPKIDDFPLIKALQANCFYIGALGSRKTHARRLERLKEAGITDAQIARVDAPIGLDIGAVSPAEIAVAILGQIINSLRQGRT